MVPFVVMAAGDGIEVVKGASMNWGVLGEGEVEAEVVDDEEDVVEEWSLGLEVSGVVAFFEGKGEGGEC